MLQSNWQGQTQRGGGNPNAGIKPKTGMAPLGGVTAFNGPTLQTSGQGMPRAGGGAGGYGFNMSGSDGPMGGDMATSGQGRARGGMGGGMGGTTSGQWGADGVKLQSFGPGNDLSGTSVMPTNSAATNQAQNWTQTAGQQYNDFSLSPFKAVGPLDYSQERGMLTDANGKMQALGYNFGGANGQYGTAQGMLGDAAKGAQGYMDRAASMASGDLSGGGGYQQSADVTRARELAMKGLEGAQGPDRVALAGDALKILEERSAPGYEQSLRSVNQKSAAMGRRGSGVTTNELGDVTLARERELALARRDAANTAAGQTLDDKLNVINASAGVAQGFGSMDQSGASINDAATRASSSNRLQSAGLMQALGRDSYGMGADAANMAYQTGDRFADQDRDRVGLGERQSEFTRSAANDMGGMTRDTYDASVKERNTARDDEFNQGDFLGRRFGENDNYQRGREDADYNRRTEVRGERGYQDMTRRAATEDERTRMFDEEQLRNGRYNRALGTASLGFGAEAPTGAYEGAANRARGEAGDYYSAIGDWAQAYGQRAGGSPRRSGAGSGGTNYAGIPAYG